MRALLYKIRMRWKYNQCHKYARLIAGMGYDNLGQKDLDDAKDKLYEAAIIFKQESEK